ncbi:MBL fold metallo-hydrolase RNA specificity domain-containing protein [Algibacter sp. 2305UL17-15]|uniref:MBL fold metallo-hydrolase RNA specificity domain-containing protein n=1 Tax=Algibacter sp. 2305UL17-15 TaxID=3231268 RepID=UPI003457FFC7
MRFFGKYYPIKATIKRIESLSAHADQKELLDWMGNIKNRLENVFLIHGEPTTLDGFRVKIKNTFNWQVTIPKLTDVEKVML